MLLYDSYGELKELKVTLKVKSIPDEIKTFANKNGYEIALGVNFITLYKQAFVENKDNPSDSYYETHGFCCFANYDGKFCGVGHIPVSLSKQKEKPNMSHFAFYDVFPTSATDEELEEIEELKKVLNIDDKMSPSAFNRNMYILMDKDGEAKNGFEALKVLKEIKGISNVHYNKNHVYFKIDGKEQMLTLCKNNSLFLMNGNMYSIKALDHIPDLIRKYNGDFYPLSVFDYDKGFVDYVRCGKALCSEEMQQVAGIDNPIKW